MDGKGEENSTMIDKKVQYTVKKLSDFPVARRDVTNQIFFRLGIIQLFLASESSDNYIPAGDGKNYYLFYSVEGGEAFLMLPHLLFVRSPLLASRRHAKNIIQKTA